MADKLKTFDFHIQFDSVGVKVKAKNKREAKAALVVILKKSSAYKYLDKRNLFVTEL